MFKKTELLIFIILIITCFSVCKFDLPTQSSSDNLLSGENNFIKTIWDPFIGIHLFTWDLSVIQPHLLKLIEAGALKGARVGGLDNPDVQRFIRWLYSRNVEVLGSFDNKFLREPNIYTIFDQMVLQNPTIRNWEVGNEVSGFIGMEPEEYMKIAGGLFYYVKQNYPHLRLAIGAVAGNGSSADILRRMIDAGLNKLCRDGLEIVPIHFYSWKSARLGEFKSQIARLPISTRIWVTETNEMPPSWDRQVEYVKKVYPLLRSSLRAERIYWYVFSEPSDFSLVKGLVDGGAVEYSPLMNLLIGANKIDSTLTDTTINPVSPENMLLMPPDKKRERNPVRENPREKKQQ